ncbi:MAG: gamma-glutamylcyclotransferase family protein [Verrucomicrobiota bacterium]
MKQEESLFLSGVLVFAYGSNMCPEQMVKRCPAAEVVGVGVLAGHTLVFPRWSKRWKGGVAGIARSSVDSNVEGIVWKISEEDLINLDRFEGFKATRPVDQNSYNRVPMEITLLPNRKISCEVYVAVALGDYLPSQAYLGKIHKGQEFILRLKNG